MSPFIFILLVWVSLALINLTICKKEEGYVTLEALSWCTLAAPIVSFLYLLFFLCTFVEKINWDKKIF